MNTFASYPDVEGLQNMTMGALEAFLPIYAVEVAGLSAFEAGLLWAVQIVATMVSKPLMGRVSDRFGRKPIIVAGLILCAISFVAIPLLKNFAALSAVALLFGLGEAFVTSSSAAMVADMCKARHFGTAMGVFGTIFDSEKEKSFAKGCKDKGVWLELFCPDDACFTVESHSASRTSATISCFG